MSKCQFNIWCMDGCKTIFSYWMYIFAKVDGLGPCCAGTFCYSSLALSFLISYPEYSISSHKSTVSQLLTEVLQCDEKNSKQLGPSLEKYIARNNKWCGVTFVAVFTMLLCWASAVSLPTETLVANYLYALLISHNNNNAPHPWIQNSNQPEKIFRISRSEGLGPSKPFGPAWRHHSWEWNTAWSLDSKEDVTRQVYLEACMSKASKFGKEILARVMLAWFAWWWRKACVWKALKLFKPSPANQTLMIFDNLDESHVSWNGSAPPYINTWTQKCTQQLSA